MYGLPNGELPPRAPDSGVLLCCVIGVFIALAAESWWSEREDRLRESDIREDIVAEFAANIRRWSLKA